MKLNLLSTQNTVVGELEVSENLILAEPNSGLVHQLLLLQHTRPTRSANTKTRAEVRGGGAKPWRQKGTGRARAGSLRSPLFAGGGVIFGPRAGQRRSVQMPKRARKKALCSALTLKKEHLFILKDLPDLPEVKTKEGYNFLKNMGLEERKVLFIFDQNAEKAISLKQTVMNLPKVDWIYWQNLNVHDLFKAEAIVIDQITFKQIEAWL